MQTSDWIALLSLGVAALALWRTEVVGALRARTTILQGQESLRLELDRLAKYIPHCLQSRQRVASANGQRGNAEAFRLEVERDLPELERLRTRVSNVPEVPLGLLQRRAAIASDAEVELHAIQVRVQQLADRYAAAWAEDEAARERIWEGVLARTRDRGGGGRQA